MVEILYNPKIIDYLDALPQPLQYEINDTLDYITTFGKQADLPDARRIVQLTNTWESRNQMTIAGRRYTIRILIRFHTDDLAYATVAGDKDRWAGTQSRVVRRLRRRLRTDLQRDERHPMTNKYDNPDAFLVDAGTLPATRDLDEGRTTAELERRSVERNFRHAMANLVRQARTSANISQSDAAAAWAAQQPHVSRFEKDPGNAHAATLISYLAALGADIDINIRLADHRDNISIRDGEVRTAAELV